MSYMGNRWGICPTKSKVTFTSVEYAEKRELNDFSENVNKMHADLDETMHRTDVLARHVYELQHEVREMRFSG